ncbi:SseB family protein [Micromonospora sp. C28SCA-DRY-2]|uniref:SseB family protein n=1 Tax=Micromonospora sp. C28SCA-DRY-2 TaxID=3059522 RepID=UPI002676ADCF|nr:SseB family protein [Micromonospora sp. C28SCA-DRY-2]MDO3705852.1 SseB family protein [Micromonospora sp. C28SCA-DRY-2]
MTSPSWPEIVDRLRDTLARCDRDTDLELAAGPRRLHLLVRRDTVRLHCPGYDEARLAALGWHRPADGSGGWWYETPRTPERLDRLSAFVARTAAEVLTADPGALSCRALPPTPVPVPAVPQPATTPAPAPGRGHPPVDHAPVGALRGSPGQTEVPTGEPAAVGSPALATARATATGAGGTDLPGPAIAPTPTGGPGTAAGPHPTAQPTRAAGTGPSDGPNPTAPRLATDAGTAGGAYPTAQPTPAGGTGAAGGPNPTGPRAALDAGTGPADSPYPTAGSTAAAGAGPSGTGAPERTVAELLAEAAGRRDLPGYLGVLAAAPVCVPLAAEPSPEADFPWTVATDPAGAPLLPVFTSPEALTAFAGADVPFIALACADLFADWPDRSWGLVVDPGTPQSVALAAPALADLLAANAPAG